MHHQIQGHHTLTPDLDTNSLCGISRKLLIPMFLYIHTQLQPNKFTQLQPNKFILLVCYSLCSKTFMFTDPLQTTNRVQ